MQRCILLLAHLLCGTALYAQDTFSIVAVDSVTGEVGSAGASCVDLFQTSLSSDDFLSQLIPGVGAINTQAYYLPANQNNATTQMNAGLNPDQIIQWLIANDAQNQPQIRQYGIAALVNGSPQASAFTGSSTNDYKNHIVGPNYAIQGNILLGQEVLDSMEARFLAEEGDLACKLMAALQGAKMVGADTRCAANGTSSLFAFVKVSQSNDPFGSPSFLVSVRTSDGTGIEPIDSLQVKFNLEHSCTTGSLAALQSQNPLFSIYPNPAEKLVHVVQLAETSENCKYSLTSLDGSIVLQGEFQNELTLDISALERGNYLLKLVSDKTEVVESLNVY